MKAFQQQVQVLWEERVCGQYLFRGMDRHDVTDPLDPNRDPFDAVKPQLFRLIEVLQNALASGFEFTVHESYRGLSNDLRNILKWHEADLKDNGIDFTSSYESACCYSNNYQGSQLKQDFRYITEHLHDRKQDHTLSSCMTEQDWSIVSELYSWIMRDAVNCERVVVWVDRSSAAFDDCTRCLPLGSLEIFTRNVMGAIEEQHLPSTIESAVEVLPHDTFHYRMRRQLPLNEVVRIETQA